MAEHANKYGIVFKTYSAVVFMAQKVNNKLPFYTCTYPEIQG